MAIVPPPCGDFANSAGGYMIRRDMLSWGWHDVCFMKIATGGPVAQNRPIFGSKRITNLDS